MTVNEKVAKSSLVSSFYIAGLHIITYNINTMIKKLNTIINAGEEIKRINYNFAHPPNRSQGILITIDDGRSDKEVTETFQLSEDIVVLNLNVDRFWVAFLCRL